MNANQPDADELVPHEIHGAIHNACSISSDPIMFHVKPKPICVLSNLDRRMTPFDSITRPSVRRLPHRFKRSRRRSVTFHLVLRPAGQIILGERQDGKSPCRWLTPSCRRPSVRAVIDQSIIHVELATICDHRIAPGKPFHFGHHPHSMRALGFT